MSIVENQITPSLSDEEVNKMTLDEIGHITCEQQPEIKIDFTCFSCAVNIPKRSKKACRSCFNFGNFETK